MNTIDWTSLLFALLFLSILVLFTIFKMKPRSWEGKAIGIVIFLIVAVLFTNVFCRLIGEIK